MLSIQVRSTSIMSVMNNSTKGLCFFIGIVVLCVVVVVMGNRRPPDIGVIATPIPIQHETQQIVPTPVENIKTEQKSAPFQLVGETLQYPKGVSESDLHAAIPDLKCMNYEGRMCSAPTALDERVLLSGMPMAGSCMVGKEFTVGFKNDALSHFGCEIAPLAAENVSNLLNKKYGQPNVDSKTMDGMVSDYSEWKSGDDYIVISHFQGADINGNSLNNFSVSIGPSESLQKK